MRELVKVLCVVVLLFAAPATAVGWADGIGNAPDWVSLAVRYACPPLCVLALATFLAVHFRRDEAPDYLAARVGPYYNRGGFCFSVLPASDGGVCVLEVYFQNQHAGRCVGRVALRPARGFLLGRAEIEPVAAEIDCGPAAFGVARVPVGVPHALQGRQQRFEVGASVEYPEGRGRRLRFRDGIALRADSRFGNVFGAGLTVAGALTGQIVYSSPAAVEVHLPGEVAEDLTGADVGVSVATWWRLGDPPLSGAWDRPAGEPE